MFNFNIDHIFALTVYLLMKIVNIGKMVTLKDRVMKGNSSYNETLQHKALSS